jgi:hypothetical protein
MLHDKSLGEKPCPQVDKCWRHLWRHFIPWRRRFLGSALSCGVCASPIVWEGSEEVGNYVHSA